METKKLILIVEDEKSLSNAIQLKLSDLGYDIEAASSVADAKAIIAKRKPNLVLLDIILPGGENGFDLLEDLKRQSDTTDIPVIVLSNLGTEEEVSRKIGANEYLVKSNTSLENIKQKITEYLK